MKTYQVNVAKDGKVFWKFYDLDIYKAKKIEQELLAEGHDAYICEVIKLQKLAH